jgi:hypothetical protein
MTPKLDELAIKCSTFMEETGRIVEEISKGSEIMEEALGYRYHDIIHDMLELQAEIWNVKSEVGE